MRAIWQIGRLGRWLTQGCASFILLFGKLEGCLRDAMMMNAELTPRMLAQARVIAKGNRIRDVQRLVLIYGGRPSKWTKKSSPQFELQGVQYEYHWYEHPGIGRVEVKRKQVDEQ